jgi:hypothetical protein
VWTWLALIGTPLVSLANLGMAHALTTPSCAHQTEVWLHLLHAASIGLCLGLCLVFVLMAWRHRAPSAGQRDDAADLATRQRFVSSISVPTGVLFTLVTLMQWVSVWVLSPCAA